MLTRFCVEDGEGPEEVTVKLEGFGDCEAELYLLDDNNDLALVGKETVSGETVLTLTAQASYLIKLKK